MSGDGGTHTFTDTEGRRWTIRITIDVVRRVKSTLGIDVLKLSDDKVLSQLMDDPMTLCDLVYVCIMDQTDHAGVTDEQFGRAMDGDVLDAALAAFLEALVDFFPRPRRAVLRRGLGKIRELQDRIAADVLERLEDPELADQAIKAARQATYGPTSGNSQESSGSTRQD